MDRDQMRAEYEASVDAAEEVTGTWFEWDRDEAEGCWCLYEFARTPGGLQARMAKLGADAHRDPDEGMRDVTRKNWAKVEQATAGSYVRRPLTYMSSEFDAALEEAEGDDKAGFRLMESVVVVNGVHKRLGDCTKQDLERLGDVAKRASERAERRRQALEGLLLQQVAKDRRTLH